MTMLDRLQTESFSIALKLLMAAAFFLMLCTAAWAADVSAQKDGSSDIVAPQENAGKSCDESWTVLWTKVQNKQPEAIEELAVSVGYGWLTLPRETSAQDILALTIYHSYFNPVLTSLGTADIYSKKVKDRDSFLACIHQGAEKSCAEAAIENGVVSSFDGFVEDINNRLAQGAKPACPKE
jgi:hypothetical protein